MARHATLALLGTALAACVASVQPSEHPALTELERRRHLALVCFATAPATSTAEERTNTCSRELFRYFAYREGLVVAVEHGVGALQRELPTAPLARRALARCLETHSVSRPTATAARGPCELEYWAHEAYEGPLLGLYSTLLNAELEAIGQHNGLESLGRFLHSPATRDSERFGNQQDNRVYDREECIGPVVDGRCKGQILPTKAYHPKCYGEWLHGDCTGPLF